MLLVCFRTPIEMGQYRRTQALQVVTALVSDAVHIERGRTNDTAALAAGQISLDAAFNLFVRSGRERSDRSPGPTPPRSV